MVALMEIIFKQSIFSQLWDLKKTNLKSSFDL